MPRKCCYSAQQEDYSDKKTYIQRRILLSAIREGIFTIINSSYSGKIHDKKILDDLDIKCGSVSLVMDLGFLGAPEEHPTAILPIKKPKGKKLNKIAKQFNQRLASARVKIEHAFAGIKRLKIIRQKIRIPCY